MVKAKCKLGTALSPFSRPPPPTPACHFDAIGSGCVEWLICSRGLTAAHMPAMILVLVDHAQKRACCLDTHPGNYHMFMNRNIRKSFANLEASCKAN